MNALRVSYCRSSVISLLSTGFSSTNAGCVCKSCSHGRPNCSPTSSPTAKNNNPPQSWRSLRITAGVAAAAGQSKSVSHSRKSESKTMTGFPCAKASDASSINFDESILLMLRRGQTTPFFSVVRIHLGLNVCLCAS